MLNWAVIGIGDITRKRVIAAIQSEPRSRLHGVVSRDPEKGRAYADREEALQDAAVEAVYVATPVILHASQSIAARRSGRHVLCEKPMALNYSEALQMLRVARELKNAGAIGQPVLAEIRCHDSMSKPLVRPVRLEQV